jgi:hypothetical protein
MLYWSRTGNGLDLLLWLGLCSLWVIGGWLLSCYAFRQPPRQRLVTGLASGWLLFIVFSNLLGKMFPISAAYWGAAGIILILGVGSAWQSSYCAPRSSWYRLLLDERKNWQILVAFAGLMLVFSMINRGLAIFDDFANLPIVSQIAAGDYPPHFHLNPEKELDYHYGLHLFAASLARIGGFYPWSAFDFTRTLSTTLTILLAWLWLRRNLRRAMARWAGILLIVFGGGARWLLLFLPAETLQRISAEIQLIGSALQSGPDLFTILPGAWKIVGGGPLSFPFAFVNGIFSPLPLQLSGMAAAPYMTMFLLLLLAQNGILRRRRPWRFNGLLLGVFIGSLGLTAEHMFVIIWSGIALAILISFWSNPPLGSEKLLQRLLRDERSAWAWVLLPSALLAVLGGGVLTEFAQQIVMRLSGNQIEAGVGLSGMQLRWPMAMVSAHLGVLEFNKPSHILVGFLEMGPAVLLAPYIIWLAKKSIRQKRIVIAGLCLGTLISFAAPLFIQLTTKDRDISRLTEAALFTWLALGFPFLWMQLQQRGANSLLPSFSITKAHAHKAIQFAIVSAILITVFAGLATFPNLLLAIARPQLSHFIDEPDALMSKAYFDRLEPQAKILDPGFTYRPTVLFARTTGPANWNVYIELPEFRQLLADLDPVAIAQAGYTYMYFDRNTWQKLSQSQRRLYLDPCVKLIQEQRTALGDFRRLLDIRTCADRTE